MFYSRIAVSMAAAALVLISSSSSLVPAYAAAPPAGDFSCYNTVIETGECLDFPDFALSEMPELTAGEKVVFSGVGASMSGLAVDQIELFGGFDPYRGRGDGVAISTFEGSVNADGSWSVAMTVPSQEILDRAKGEELGVWFTVSGTEGKKSFIRSTIYPVTIKSAPVAGKKGWYRTDGAWFWGDDKGVQARGWKSIGSAWYFFDSASGAMVTGWVKDGGSWYYLAPSGAMVAGWVKDGGSWYYLAPSGAMVTGWVKDGGSWYYLAPSGAMVTGWAIVDGRWSLFSSSGVWERYQ